MRQRITAGSGEAMRRMQTESVLQSRLPGPLVACRSSQGVQSITSIDDRREDTPSVSSGQSFSAISLSSGRTHAKGSYRKPVRIHTDEKFVVKVQGGTEFMPIMVYDESRTCQFDIEPGKPVS